MPSRLKPDISKTPAYIDRQKYAGKERDPASKFQNSISDLIERISNELELENNKIQ